MRKSEERSKHYLCAQWVMPGLMGSINTRSAQQAKKYVQQMSYTLSLNGAKPFEQQHRSTA
eukprot:1098690-Pelagomonas_calceolata.AAC.8